MTLPKPTQEQQTILNSKCACKIVVAVPGSGKSTLLFQAIQQYYTQKQQPGHCLMLTFSKKSDNDNKKKGKTLFFAHRKQLDIRTFDSFCCRILKQHWQLAGYKKRPDFDNGYNQKILQAVYDSIALQKHKDRLPFEDVESIIKQVLETQESSLKAIASVYKKGLYANAVKPFTKILAEYQHHKKSRGIIGFKEQVEGCYQLFVRHPELLQTIAQQYGLLLIDETQDLSPVQLKIAIMLAGAIKQSFFVADDAQNIYSFRGVKATNLKTLEQALSKAKVFTLTQSHRCTKPVALLASKLRQAIQEVRNIKMWSEKEGDKPDFYTFANKNAQYRFVTQKIVKLHHQGMAYSDMAIIARKHESLVNLQRYLQLEMDAFHTAYDDNRTFTPTLLALLLDLMVNGYQESLVDKILLSLDITSTEENFAYVKAELSSTNKTARKNCNKHLKLFGDLIRKGLHANTTEARVRFIHAFLVSYSTKVASSQSSKKSDKHYFNAELTGATMLAKQGIDDAQMLEHLYALGKSDQGGVSLLTAHGAKGLEFKVVFVIDADNTLFPYVHSHRHHDNENDERKLFYVAITRCSQTLIMSSVYNEASNIKPTDFILKLKGFKRIINITDTTRNH
ncbi:UvrD-helicase domain-containing protein [Candidatus Methylobacter oryzae]|uniref:DNA 3'-5' helicase n=1 Tax=Candidatus Methylobacter oryzae TaxID=2497749 RepID=A0ABY3C9S8_9GAMM|nr:ATP-dependent helicase [Candidatus Methylobacter oryzae]TRW93319.1 ATP-dependent helicase [Candidatus Methylobacter oryzae]